MSTPKRLLVPAEPTAGMINAAADRIETTRMSKSGMYGEALMAANAASPSAGKVTREMLLDVAAVISAKTDPIEGPDDPVAWARNRIRAWAKAKHESGCGDPAWSFRCRRCEADETLDCARAALEALGLEVES